MKRRIICIFVLFVLLSVWTIPVDAGPGSLSEFDAQALDAFITGQMSRHGIQGGSLAVTSKTEIIYLKNYGMGWFVEQGHFFHGGANEAFKTYVDIYPLRDMSSVLLVNQGYMLDHYISAEQIFKGVEAILLGRISPPVTEGWSVKYIGWALLAFVLALSIFQIRNLFSLRGWMARARNWSTGKKIWDTAISFLIPTIILILVISQLKAFYGYRFNLTYQMVTMSRTLTDITVLMVVGSVPDYVPGFVKLFWLVSGKTRKI